MSKLILTPAIGEQFNNTWGRKLQFEGFDLKWFTPKSHFDIEASLQCCYYPFMTKGIFDYRESVNYPKNKILICDSAGFQFASFKKRGEVCKLKPIDSLRWQELNADIAMNMDVPPTLGDVTTLEEFDEALKQSVENFEIFEKNRVNYKMWLYNVLHGETLALQERWYNKVKQFTNFDGFAIGMKPSFDPMLQAQGFMFLLEKGELDKSSCKGVHFFGTTGKHVSPTLVYLASKINKYVSYDSSSYNIGSIFRTYYSPLDIGCHLSFGDKFKTENPLLTELPCQCPVCKSVKDINVLNTGEIYAGTLVSLHNLYQYDYYNNILNKLVKQKDKFMEYITKIGIDDKTLKSIEFIDFALEKGLTLAVKKFENYLQPQHLIKCKQVDIFHF